MKNKIHKIFSIVFILSITSCSSTKEIDISISQNESQDYSKETGYFIDKRDGKKYKWVKIGEQIWMAENLAFKANSGCVAFKHKENKAKKYGYYYSWESAKKSCPEGWHLPTKKELLEIQKYIGEFGHEAYDSLQKNDYYGLNFTNSGYYDQKNDDFLRTILKPFIVINYWTSCSFDNISGQKSIYTFTISHFRKEVNFYFYSSDAYYPVRCIKD